MAFLRERNPDVRIPQDARGLLCSETERSQTVMPLFAQGCVHTIRGGGHCVQPSRYWLPATRNPTTQVHQVETVRGPKGKSKSQGHHPRSRGSHVQKQNGGGGSLVLAYKAEMWGPSVPCSGHLLRTPCHLLLITLKTSNHLFRAHRTW